MKELISVIVPIYNVEEVLPRCIDSIIGQTYKNLEIILIDDGSPDNSGKICDEYAKQDSRIKVLHQENSGVSSARNKGMSIMKGKYFSFVDSDDIIDSKYFEILYTTIKKENFDICISRTNSFDNNQSLNAVNRGVLKKYNLLENKEEKITEIVNEYFGSGAATKLYKNKKNMLDFENIKIGEDLLFNIDYMLNSTDIVVIDYNGYFYRNNEKSLTNSIKKDLFDSLNKIIKKRNFQLPIYKVYCFRIYNEQIYNIYKNDKNKVYLYLKSLTKYKDLKDIITKKDNVKEIIKLTKKKKTYIKTITFMIRNDFYKAASFVEKIKYFIKEKIR